MDSLSFDEHSSLLPQLPSEIWVIIIDYCSLEAMDNLGKAHPYYAQLITLSNSVEKRNLRSKFDEVCVPPFKYLTNNIIMEQRNGEVCHCVKYRIGSISSLNIPGITTEAFAKGGHFLLIMTVQPQMKAADDRFTICGKRTKGNGHYSSRNIYYGRADLCPKRVQFRFFYDETRDDAKIEITVVGLFVLEDAKIFFVPDSNWPKKYKECGFESMREREDND